MSKQPNLIPNLIRFTILDLVCLGIGIYYYLIHEDIIYLLAGAFVGSMFLIFGFIIPSAINKNK